MSQLIIADLNFLESEFPSKSQVKGGKRKFGKKFTVAGVKVAYGAAWDADYAVGSGGAAAAAARGTGAAVSLSGKDADVDVDAEANAEA